MKQDGLSLIIYAHENAHDLLPFIGEIDSLISPTALGYEVLIVEDFNSKPDKSLFNQFPVKFFHVKDKKRLSQRLAGILTHANYGIIATLADTKTFTLETIMDMAKVIYQGQSDVLIAQTKKPGYFESLLGLNHDGGKIDVRSGLKVFKKEVAERLKPEFLSFSFDMEFITYAKDAGYKVDVYQVDNFLEHKTHGSLWDIFYSKLKTKFGRRDVIPFHPEQQQEKGLGFHYRGEEFVHHSNLTAKQSAIHRLSGTQMFVLALLAIATIEFFILDWHLAVIVFIAVLTFLYFGDLLFNLYLIYRSFSKPAELEITKSDIDEVKVWPTYTILCPLYKEWSVIPQFVTAMSQLDYPKDKLQVMLLLEEDDKQSQEEVKKFSLPSYFDVVVVPDSKPKTKPKASNYGLLKATGEYVVIFDAEDVPDPLQLKKAIAAFQKAGPRIVCIQAKLNFYNPHQNVLTRVFTAEYSLWFDLVLTGLQSIHAPIPLGGTSNHFRKADLVNLKGWDSFNVTEDCDLGMRLVKQGKQTAVINSITLEEANSDMANWFSQRTRWIKGYMQTYLVHMRTPKEFFINWKEPHALTFQMVVGGKILSMFINPLMWIITICYFAFRANVGTFIESFFPAPVLYMGVTSLLLGNFLYVYYYMIGCAKHGHHELVKYGILVPFYWLAMSIAAWMAVYKLIVAPHYWAKTKHGLHLNNAKAIEHAHKAIGGKELVDKDLTNRAVPLHSMVPAPA